MPKFLHVEESDVFLDPQAIVAIEVLGQRECDVYLTSGDSIGLSISAVDLIQRIERMANTNG